MLTFLAADRDRRRPHRRSRLYASVASVCRLSVTYVLWPNGAS